MKNLLEAQIKTLLLLNRFGAKLRRRAVNLLLDRENPEEVLDKIKSGSSLEEKEAREKIEKKFDTAREWEMCQEAKIQCFTLVDETYPSFLKKISDPPIVLYVKGEMTELDEASIAVVGSRHPSFYGLSQARKLSYKLSEAGLTIVSGFAKGIDQAAHEGALEIPFGRTIAVMGCGIDVMYPKQNKKLYDTIEERGAIISEYPFGTPPLAENFPRRNRILSGLSSGVLVVEAHSRSGSLITAHQGLEQGKDVFALPGPVDNLTSRGTHQLIKDGAMLIETSQDILEIIIPQLKNTINTQKEKIVEEITEKRKKRETNEDNVLINILGTNGALRYEEFLRKSNMNPSEFAVSLTNLEISKRIKKANNGKYALL